MMNYGPRGGKTEQEKTDEIRVKITWLKLLV